jgi:hypothetical protein
VNQVAPKLRIDGLTRLEQLELTDALPAGQVEAQLQETLVGGMHGDLGTWQVLIEVTGQSLPLLALWLLKRRKKSVVEFEKESSDARGWERYSIRVEESEESAPEGNVLRQLTDFLQASRLPGPGSSGPAAPS